MGLEEMLADVAATHGKRWMDDEVPKPSKGKPAQAKRTLSLEAAQSMASDLEGYDSRIVAGRLT